MEDSIYVQDVEPVYYQFGLCFGFRAQQQEVNSACELELKIIKRNVHDIDKTAAGSKSPSQPGPALQPRTASPQTDHSGACTNQIIPNPLELDPRPRTGKRFRFWWKLSPHPSGRQGLSSNLVGINKPRYANRFRFLSKFSPRSSGHRTQLELNSNSVENKPSIFTFLARLGFGHPSSPGQTSNVGSVHRVNPEERADRKSVV